MRLVELEHNLTSYISHSTQTKDVQATDQAGGGWGEPSAKVKMVVPLMPDFNSKLTRDRFDNLSMPGRKVVKSDRKTRPADC